MIPAENQRIMSDNSPRVLDHYAVQWNYLITIGFGVCPAHDEFTLFELQILRFDCQDFTDSKTSHVSSYHQCLPPISRGKVLFLLIREFRQLASFGVNQVEVFWCDEGG